MATPPPSAATRALHTPTPDPRDPRPLLTPIHQTATFAQPRPGDPTVAHTYSRCSNPTVSALEARLASLFQARTALAFKTGLAAITTLFMTTLKAGDHVLCGAVVYGGTVRLLRDVLSKFGVQVTFVDLVRQGVTDLAAARAAMCPNTRLVFVETPANPTLAVCDLAGLERIAREGNARFVVDNTFLTAHLQPVLADAQGRAPWAADLRGADVEVLSTTKFVEGHNATTGGALLTHDSALAAELQLQRGALGTIQAPFDAWLTLRGLGTLPLRLERHSASAERIARALQAHPAVRAVHYPGLAPDGTSAFGPQASAACLARRQQRAGGGVLAFELDPAHVPGFLAAVKLCTLAENLGAAETLLTLPATMTHGQLPPAERARLGISDGLVRLSVGLEDPGDILLDLERALTHTQHGAFASTGQSGGGAQ